ncbi:hypothetical protein [Siphonobacter sp. SORGH_AS_0500]|uniref:hypothetical protein n=1 Tax=Siphonobacter sp. SORGH_AS_0500 TaxID=1864824 RepID=UPI002860FA85|nr:hypothetical protein [Siphonobacter sp. SORGH_AS_0500]MDR6195950.1 hypothetical protein [Siphonobacter sp. SORGH_AS_0500]
MVQRLNTIAAIWNGGRIPDKQKTLILRKYRDKFGISRHTANNTLVGNGKRSPSAVDPKELRFLEKELSNVIKEYKAIEKEPSILEPLLDD